jgi:hypothetical protein
MSTKKLPRELARPGTLEETYDKVIKDLREMEPRPHGLLAEFQERKIVAMAGGSAFKMHESGLRDCYEAQAAALLGLRREIPEAAADYETARLRRAYAGMLLAMADVRAIIDARRKPRILDVESAVRPLNGA